MGSMAKAVSSSVAGAQKPGGLLGMIGGPILGQILEKKMYGSSGQAGLPGLIGKVLGSAPSGRAGMMGGLFPQIVQQLIEKKQQPPMSIGQAAAGVVGAQAQARPTMPFQLYSSGGEQNQSQPWDM